MSILSEQQAFLRRLHSYDAARPSYRAKPFGFPLFWRRARNAQRSESTVLRRGGFRRARLRWVASCAQRDLMQCTPSPKRSTRPADPSWTSVIECKGANHRSNKVLASGRYRRPRLGMERTRFDFGSIIKSSNAKAARQWSFRISSTNSEDFDFVDAETAEYNEIRCLSPAAVRALAD